MTSSTESVPGTIDACRRDGPSRSVAPRVFVSCTSSSIWCNNKAPAKAIFRATGVNRPATPTTIPPGVSETFSVPFDRLKLQGLSLAKITTTATPGNSATDLHPHNNRRTDLLQLR